MTSKYQMGVKSLLEKFQGIVGRMRQMVLIHLQLSQFPL